MFFQKIKKTINNKIKSIDRLVTHYMRVFIVVLLLLYIFIVIFTE